MPHDDPRPETAAPDEPARTIPDPGFAADRGEADPRVRRALAEHVAGRASSGAVLATLQDARLLVPVVAVLGEVEHDAQGLAHDKSSDMAAVLVQAADGSTGLLAFTSTETMARWDPGARPVPVTAATAATAAVQDGAEALLVDLAGPAPYVVDGEDLTRLAAGWRLVGVGEDTAGLARRRNDPLTFRVDRSVPPQIHGGADPAKRRQHHRLPPAPIALHHRSSGQGPVSTGVARPL